MGITYYIKLFCIEADSHNGILMSNLLFVAETMTLFKLPQRPKLADITPLYKKGKNDHRENYRSVIILPNLSKIFEICIFKQMSQFFERTFSNQQRGFCKGLSTQQCLLVLFEKWKRSVDRGKVFGANNKN